MTESRYPIGIERYPTSGSTPATSTKVSESPDCDNSSLEAAFKAVWAAFFIGSISPTRDPFRQVLPEMLVNIRVNGAKPSSD